MDVGEFPLLSESIREREQATLPVETEAPLDNYRLHWMHLSFGREIVTAVGYILGKRQGVAVWLFGVRTWGKRGQLWLTVITVFRPTVPYVVIGVC